MDQDIDVGLFDEPLEIDSIAESSFDTCFNDSFMLAQQQQQQQTFTQLYQRPFEVDYRDLVVNQKRLDAIESFLKGTKRILIIKGPSGSGKTTAISSLLRRDGICPIDGHSLESLHRPRLNLIGEGTLMKRGNSGYVLFDNLPLIDSQSKIERCINGGGGGGANKIILCITGSSTGNGGEDCKDHRSIEHSKYLHSLEEGNEIIEFIPLSQTSIKKVLKEERLSVCASGSDLSNHLIQSILASGASERDESFSFLHSLGKILYGNKEREVPLSPIALCSRDPLLFRRYLHYNYPFHLISSASTSFESLSHLCFVSHLFSLSDNKERSSFLDALGELGVFWGVGTYKRGCSKSAGFIPIKSPFVENHHNHRHHHHHHHSRE